MQVVFFSSLPLSLPIFKWLLLEILRLTLFALNLCEYHYIRNCCYLSTYCNIVMLTMVTASRTFSLQQLLFKLTFIYFTAKIYYMLECWCSMMCILGASFVRYWHAFCTHSHIWCFLAQLNCHCKARQWTDILLYDV